MPDLNADKKSPDVALNLSLPPLTSPAELPPTPEVTLRRTDDPVALRQAVYDSVLSAAQTMEPIVGPTHTLALTDVHYTQEDPPEYDLAEEKQAALERRSLTRRLKGTWQLFDNATGEAVSSRTATVANVPSILHDGSILNKGTRYTLGYQQRLKPGVYTRRRKSGEVEAHINAKPGQGSSHRYVLRPETGVFYFNIGHANIPLVPMLDILGVKREQLEEAWGKRITDANYNKQDRQAVSKLYNRLVPKRERDEADARDTQAQREKIKSQLLSTAVDSDVTYRTLGVASPTLTPEMVLAATQKVLQVQRGEADADDRDHLAFATFHSAPDIFGERFTKDYGRLRQDLLRKASRRGNVDNIPSSILDKQLSAAIFNSGIATTTEQINPVSMLSEMTRLTRFGEGGLSSTQATPDESRNVNVGQFGFVDIATTPESLKIGADGYLSKNTYIGSDNQLYTEVVDRRTKERIKVNAMQLLDGSVEFEGSPIPGRALGVNRGKMELVRRGSSDYVIDDFEQLFGHSANATPMKSAMFAQRGSMASRMVSQALSLEEPEAPLVQSGVKGTENYSHEDALGERAGAIRSPDRGQVLEVKPTHITVQYPRGETRRFPLDNNRPGARKTLFTHYALVEPGQDVEPGQLLARSNYTDENGTLALGRNLRVGLMSLEDNWEDGIVVSESAAQKLRVQQAYRYGVDKKEGKKVNKRSFLQVFGDHYDDKQLSVIDDDGVIKPGTEVKKGDPLLLALTERDGVTSRVHSKGRSNYRDASLTWDHNHSGIVTDAVKTKAGAQVVVKTAQSLQVGSKVSGRAGNKGVVSIWPDEHMPRDAQGNPIEVAISPLAVPSRGNSSFPIEILLGKVARKRGAPYKIVDGELESLQDYAAKEAERHGVPQTEVLTDPRTGKEIPNILTGEMFVMALSHQAEAKQSSRGLGAYSSEGSPLKGADDDASAKRFSGQQLYAALSHGAYDYSRESSLLRGTRNDDYWNAFMAGQQLHEPFVSEQYEGFMQRLQAAGINPVRRGSKTRLMALTDKDVDQLAEGRYVTSMETYDNAKRKSEVPGGLFDPKLFGDGDKFAAYQFSEPTVNPIFEEPIRRLLGVTEKQFRGILGGSEEIPGFGSGPRALHKKLASIDLDAEINRSRSEIRGTKKTARDAAIRRMQYLRGLKKAGTNPADLMVSQIPVLPPRLRPITEMQGTGTLMVNDANFLYRELISADENLKRLTGQIGDLSDERLALYDSFKALAGLQEPANPELKQRKVQGILKTVLGKGSPKSGVMQRKLLSGTVDTVGRGVIMVDPNLDMDTVGLPESMAYRIFEPYVVRDMVSKGVAKVQAMKHLEDRDQVAKESLLDVMQTRPVTISRAPILHKFGDVGQWATLVAGDAVRYNPVIAGPQNADFDGDQQIGCVVFSVSSCILQEKELTRKVLGVESEEVFSTFSEIDMASMTKMGVPFEKNRKSFVCDLEDFPHYAEVLRTSKGRCGDVDWYAVDDNIQVLSIDPQTKELRWSPVSAWSVHRGCAVVIVTTSSKRQIFTDNDPRGLLVCRPGEGSLQLSTMSPLKVGDESVWIPRSATLERTGGGTRRSRVLRLPERLWAQPRDTRSWCLPDRLTLDFDLGWLAGVMAGKGWVTTVQNQPKKFRATYLASDSYDVLHRFHAIASRLLTASKLSRPTPPELPYNKREGDGTREQGYGESLRASISSPAFAECCAILCGKAAANKRLPPVFLTANVAFREGLLAGLMDTAGCVTACKAKAKAKPQLNCSYSTISLRLAREVSLLAQSLGIPASVRKSKVTDAGNQAWVVLFSTYAYKTWAMENSEQFAFKERLKVLQDTPVTSASESGTAAAQDKVPITLAVCNYILSQLQGKLQSKEWNSFGITLKRVIRKKTWGVPRFTAEKAIGLPEPADASLRAQWREWVAIVENTQVTWDTVKSVENTGHIEQGYDLSVPGDENWMNETGLFVPNTVNVHVPHSPRVVAEVASRMMPSKMLHGISDMRSAMFKPSQDMMLGLYEASKPADKKKRLRVFESKEAMLAALRRNEIDIDTPVRFLGSG